MKVITCDNCGKTFPQDIEVVQYKDEHGELHSLDLCAPCKNSYEDKQKKTKDDFFVPIIKKKGK